MQFFIRKYSKGKRASGTQDIWVSETPLSNQDFISICKEEGVGKYLLCVRGKGIRGFKKLDEYNLQEMNEVFEAETISIKQNVDVSMLSSEEILDIMGSMIKQAPQTPDGQAKFMADLQTFHSELSTRNTQTTNQELASENTIVSAGFPIGSAVTSFALGAITGGVIIWLVQKKTIDDLKSQINSLESSVKEAEQAIQSVKRKAEKIEQKTSMSFDQRFMQQFNAMNGWKQ
jgi:hypothetical protein|tara:strand:- start:33 stop:725 length:693 start_codon:yes stop_codon:yes gene_type:complete